MLNYVCPICKKVFSDYPSGNRKYCSRLCANKTPTKGCFKKGQFAGNKHYNWKGGITSKNVLERIRFAKEIKILVLRRDNFKCVLCGSNKQLQIDHIQSWAEYVELRFSIDNCRTLCMRCHYKITWGRPMLETIKTWGKPLKINAKY